jgi:tetratricopeptide (TPR) repeat protein
VKISKAIHVGSVASRLAVVIVFSAATAFSQSTLLNIPQQPSPSPNPSQASSPASSPRPANTEASPSPAPDKTRARRALPASSTEKPKVESVTPATESTPARTAAENKSDPGSEVKALRDEIDSATSPEVRTRLQLKLVNHLLTAGMKQEAIAELHSMSAEDHFDPQGFYNIANALARAGDTDAAINTYRKAIEQRKGRYSRALNNLGVVLMRQGHWDEAHEALISALRLESFRYAEASYNLGRLYSVRGEGDLAILEWRRAVQVDPEHKAAAQALANAGSAESITVAASRPANNSASTRASSPGPPPVGDESSGGKSDTASSNSGATSRKNAGVSRALTVDPETYAFLQRARTSRDRGRHEEAVESYRKVISRMGGYFGPANLELGYDLISLKRNDEAIAILLPVSVKDGTRYPISFYHLARLYEQRGDLKLAEENFARASQSYREGNAQFLLDLSRVREKLGDFSGALTSMEQYLSVLEREGQKPEWSNERLAALRQKISASQNEPKQ